MMIEDCESQAVQPDLDVAKIPVASLIPHRDPILLIDSLLEYQQGRCLTATKWVGDSEFWAKGHFPDFAVMPGVLVVEALAQTCAAYMALESQGSNGSNGLYVLLKSNVRYPNPVLPGDRLILSVTLEHSSAAMSIFKVKAMIDDRCSVRGEITVGVAELNKISRQR